MLSGRRGDRMVSAKIPGTGDITATSEGKSGTLTVNVYRDLPAKLVAFAGNNQSVAVGAARARSALRDRH